MFICVDSSLLFWCVLSFLLFVVCVCVCVCVCVLYCWFLISSTFHARGSILSWIILPFGGKERSLLNATRFQSDEPFARIPLCTCSSFMSFEKEKRNKWLDPFRDTVILLPNETEWIRIVEQFSFQELTVGFLKIVLSFLSILRSMKVLLLILWNWIVRRIFQKKKNETNDSIQLGIL